jgi:hypothetical protein
MCILIHHPADASFSNELLYDFYKHNPDGFGIMYGDGNKIHVTKTMGTVEETIKLYRDIAEGHECVIHYRMRTHGDTDLDNCHPYRITDDLWMAHNGILSSGNPFDAKKSDTWHFIEYVIKPIAESNIDLIFDETWLDMIGSLIGSSNKFAFCHSDGRIGIVNQDAGIHFGGSWLSNTYAWSAQKFGAVKFPKYNYGNYNYGGWTGKQSSFMDDEETLDYLPITVKKNKLVDKKFNYNKVLKAAHNSWLRGERHLIDWINNAPEKAVFFLHEWYKTDKQELYDMALDNPLETADCISEIFETNSVSESSL